MAETYTQGLTVAEGVRLRRQRRLPVKGTVLVRKNQSVERDTVLARAELPGVARVVNVAALLGIAPEAIERALLKREGDAVTGGEILGRSSGFWGLFRSKCTSPVSGHVESISTVTGQVVIRGVPIQVEVAAYLDGEIVDVFPGEGAEIEARATLVQGIFGVGGEVWGNLAIVGPGPDERLDPGRLDESHRGQVIVAGRGLMPGCIERAAYLGVRGLVVGSITDSDLRDLLGYDLGSAITGGEAVTTTLVVTEGFGDVPMAERTFRLLESKNGCRASLNGKTQIRAGVIRPEVVISSERPGEGGESVRAMGISLKIGTRVRGARVPFLGRVGTVTALPRSPVQIETEARVRVVELTFDDGSRALVPRSNIESG
ncbi:MAG: hypothetical protein KAW17_04885 [Candidatus Eisenbacteria sp.]|nr:hypothetical protein [Candidatus Eisenbacteria bacterium]